jgi:16S rRNA (guanine527-N7)-methyltransferase
MFPVKHDEASLRAAATHAGITLSAGQLARLETFSGWLVEEALPAGAIGPEEADRIVDRHVADALLFASGWAVAPATVVDVGSGAGLPGIPLAIALPDAEMTLLDRSKRRADLLRRAVRILELPNATVVERDAIEVPRVFACAVFRASFTPFDAVALVPRLVVPGGVAVIGLRRGRHPPELPTAPPGTDLDLLVTPEGILDSPAWHLRMTVR